MRGIGRQRKELGLDPIGCGRFDQSPRISHSTGIIQATIFPNLAATKVLGDLDFHLTTTTFFSLETMPNTPTISGAQWEIMNIIWAEGPATAAQVVEKLAGRMGWSPRTVKTLLNRLLKKGAIGFEAWQEGGISTGRRSNASSAMRSEKPVVCGPGVWRGGRADAGAFCQSDQTHG